MKNSTRWFIGEEPVVAEGHLGTYPDLSYGNEVTFELYFKDNLEDTETSSTGATYGGETGGTYGGSLGFTYGSNSLEYQTASERYNRLKDYLNYAGYVETSQTIGSVFFNETTDFENTPVDTLVVPIRPHRDIDQAPGVWGVITGGDDTTEIFGSFARIDLSVFVLAQYDEYGSEQEVRDEFESQI